MHQYLFCLYVILVRALILAFLLFSNLPLRRGVATSLLDRWTNDIFTERDLQRYWPIIDPALPRGAMRSLSLTAQLEGQRAVVPSHSKKRKRGDAPDSTTAPSGAQNGEPLAGVLRESGALRTPSVPGLSAEDIDELLDPARVYKERCGQCPACTAGEGKKQACEALKATRRWNDQLGAVTYAAVSQVAEKLGKPLHRSKKGRKERSGHGIRCELCKTCCHGPSKPSCLTVEAIISGTLQSRLLQALPSEMRKRQKAYQAVQTAVPVPSSHVADESEVLLLEAVYEEDKEAEQRITLKDFLEMQPWAGGVTFTAPGASGCAPTAGRGPSTTAEPMATGTSIKDQRFDADFGDEDSDEDLRWASWADYLTPRHIPGQQVPGTAHPVRADHNAQKARSRKALREEVTELARKLGVDTESLTTWVCHAGVKQEPAPIKPKKKEDQQSRQLSPRKRGRDVLFLDNSDNDAAEDSQPASALDLHVELPSTSQRAPLHSTYEECGNFNVNNPFTCDVCGAARWDGPLGQLRARVAAALQTGGLASATPGGDGELDISVLAVQVAAKIAAEGGNFIDPLPGMLPKEEKEEERKGEGSVGRKDLAEEDSMVREDEGEGTDFLQDVYLEVQKALKLMKSTGNDNRLQIRVGAVGADGQSSLQAAGRAARGTLLARSVVVVEGAVCRMVEEQAGILAAQQQQQQRSFKRIGGTGGSANGNITANIGAGPQPQPPAAAPAASLLDNGGAHAVNKVRDSLAKLLDLLQEDSLAFFSQTNGGNGQGNSTLAGAGPSALPAAPGYLFGSASARRNLSQSQSQSQSQSFALDSSSSLIGYTAFCQRVSDCLLGAGQVHCLAPSAAAGVQSSCELLYCNALSEGWNDVTLQHLEGVLRNPESLPQLTLASKVGGPAMLRHALHAMLRKWQSTAATEAPAGDLQTETGGAGSSQQQQGLVFSQQPMIATQQSQPDPQPILKGSQKTPPPTKPLSHPQASYRAHHNAAGTSASDRLREADREISSAAAEVASSMKILEDLLSSYGGDIDKELLNSGGLPSISGNTAELAEEARFARLAHVSASSLQFVYSLTHAVLNSVAQHEVEEKIPGHLIFAKRTILE